MKNFIVMTVIALVAIGEVNAQRRTIPMLSEVDCMRRFREFGSMWSYCYNNQGRWFWVEDFPAAIPHKDAQRMTIPMLSEEYCRRRFHEVGAMRGYCRNDRGRWVWLEDLPTPIPHEPAPKVKPRTEAQQRADFEYLKKRLATGSECELVRNRCLRDGVPVPVHCLPLPDLKIKRRDDINTFSALLQKPCE
ncbi:hypothetical protein [Burkholderia ubonensis]|uniref:hypothetical protein n=1 Tax=Burkholderia ubonensis TaxID=101571 RepID=UPI0012FB34AC|nr:hypothetical protein [Burkholderia ubonensis]